MERCQEGSIHFQGRGRGVIRFTEKGAFDSGIKGQVGLKKPEEEKAEEREKEGRRGGGSWGGGQEGREKGNPKIATSKTKNGKTWSLV